MAAEIIDGGRHHDTFNGAENGQRWEPGPEDDEFDSQQNSAKLFERSRIKALAGMFLLLLFFFYIFINIMIISKFCYDNVNEL